MIINNKGYNVSLEDNLYKLYIKGEYRKQLYDSVTKTNIIKNTIYDDDNKSIYFSAENVIILSDYLNKKNINDIQCIKLLYYLTRQIKYNELTNYSFYGFNLDDILVIDEKIFVIVNANYLAPIKNNEIILNYLFEKPYFNNPEIINIKSLPAKINYKCCYYSLGCLVTYLLLNTYLLVGNEILTEKQIKEILNPLDYTKIYWFIERCLNKNPDKRTLLLV
jgi:hypothetical protein